MKKRALIVLLVLQFTILKMFSQSVSINTTGNAADTSAILDISSAIKGILIPRMTAAQILAIFTPAEGLLVYQADETKGFYYYSTISGWTNLAAATGTWATLGNAGTNAATNYIGTTDNNSLIIRTNSIERIFVDGSASSVGINTNAPSSTLHVNGSMSHAVTTAPGSITLTSANYTVFLTGTSDAIVTLPSAAVSVGRIYVLVNQTTAKNTSPYYQTFTLGVTSPVIAANSSITLQSDGINWNRIQ